jgi:hypothetical protein
MLVHGEPRRKVSVQSMLHDLTQLLHHTGEDLDDWRRLLIRAGQFEEGVESLPGNGLLSFCTELTDAVATAFCLLQLEQTPGRKPVPDGSEISFDPLRLIVSRITEEFGRFVSSLDHVEIDVRIPREFEYQALYPEQFIVAAEQWAREYEPDQIRRAVEVIGVSGAGSVLTSVVAKTLSLRGFDASRRVVGREFRANPYGSKDLPIRSVQSANNDFIVVDRGPDPGGGAFPAILRALDRLHVDAARIFLFTDHSRVPERLSRHQLESWRSVSHFSVPLASLRWGGNRTLEQTLALKTRDLLGCDEVEVLDVSDGDWRRLHLPRRGDWPYSTGKLESMKFLIRGDSGEAVFWKFEGFGAYGGVESLAPPECGHFGAGLKVHLPERLGKLLGLSAFRWIDGNPLSRSSNRHGLLKMIANYLLARRVKFRSTSEFHHGMERLKKILFWNVTEGLGDEFAMLCKPWVETSWKPIQFAYGDGHMAPWEWIQTKDGLIFKTDYWGNQCDQTLIGPQAYLWDAAGVLVEWRLDSESREIFQSSLREADPGLDQSLLHFHQLAYAAFKMGVVSDSLSERKGSDDETNRLWEAFEYYRETVASLLGEQKSVESDGPVMEIAEVV